METIFLTIVCTGIAVAATYMVYFNHNRKQENAKVDEDSKNAQNKMNQFTEDEQYIKEYIEHRIQEMQKHYVDIYNITDDLNRKMPSKHRMIRRELSMQFDKDREDYIRTCIKLDIPGNLVLNRREFDVFKHKYESKLIHIEAPFMRGYKVYDADTAKWINATESDLEKEFKKHWDFM